MELGKDYTGLDDPDGGKYPRAEEEAARLEAEEQEQDLKNWLEHFNEVLAKEGHCARVKIAESAA